MMISFTTRNELVPTIVPIGIGFGKAPVTGATRFDCHSFRAIVVSWGIVKGNATLDPAIDMPAQQMQHESLEDILYLL